VKEIGVVRLFLAIQRN